MCLCMLVLQSTVKLECPCYELEQITLEVRNPFPEGGNFHILLIEYRLPTNETAGQPAQTKDKKVVCEFMFLLMLFVPSTLSAVEPFIMIRFSLSLLL